MTMSSLWRDGRPSPLPVQSTVDGEWDVVVVGAGITGLTTALLLARAGQSVALIEARQIGYGTTGGSTAKLSLLQGTTLSRIKRRHPERTVEQYVLGNLEAQAWVEQYCGQHGVDVQHRAAYTYANGALGRRSASREYDVASAAGLPVEWVDELDLPFPTQGAVRLDDQLQLDPMKLLDALAADAVRHGVTLIEGARVRRVTGKAPVRVSTTAGEARASRVVIATNMPILDRGAFFARASPERSYILAFRTPTPAVDAMYLAADSPSRSLRDVPLGGPDGDPSSLLLVGGNGHTVGRARSERAKVEDLRRWTHAHYPGAQETHAWSAQDYVTASGLPYVGPVLPGRDDILVAGGYAKWGMTNGVAAGLALSSRILGGQTQWAAAFETWTPSMLRGTVDAARINAEVGFEMTRGWLRPVAGLGPWSEKGSPEEGQGVVRYDHAGTPTAVSRVDGQVRSVSAVCPHLGGILSWNDAETSWDCPLHGSRFDADGELLEGPATCGLSQR
ncbi:FAD-dependent oxidoreductase [Nocardioides pacificus]